MVTIRRKCGIGDVETVRYSLLGVLILGDYTSTELERIFSFSELSLIRLHVNGDRLTEEQHASLVALQHKHVNHQLEIWYNLDFEAFKKNVFDRVDFIVEFDGNGSDDLLTQMRQQWIENGARFLNGNFQKLGVHQIKEKHPRMFPDVIEYWNLWK